MVAYIYYISTMAINTKVNNVTAISGKDIIGDMTAMFDGGSDYIILETDTINKNVGDTIDLKGLTDMRDYFTMSETERLQKQLNETKTQLNSASTTINTLQTNLVSALEGVAEVYEMVLSSSSSSSSS